MHLNNWSIAILLCLTVNIIIFAVRPFYLAVKPIPAHSHPIASLTRVNNLLIAHFSIGSPPQPFRGAVSLAANDLSIPSTACNSSRCFGYLKYDASLSSTANISDRNSSTDYGAFRTTGHLSSDTLHIAGIDIPNQPFIEATKQIESSPFWDHDFDTILGFSPTGNQSTGIDSVFASMINQKVLNGNRFSIEPPSHENETGTLTFGIIDDHTRLGDRILRVPLTANDIPFMPTPWQTQLDAIHTVNGSTVLHNHTVIFEPAMSTIGLPDVVLGPWLEMIHPRPLGFLLQEVDCDRRDSMPSITLEMGGHNFTIGPYEYSYEAHFKESGEMHCILDVTAGTEDISILGLSFLQRFYSVFDWDSREIGLLPTDEFHR